MSMKAINELIVAVALSVAATFGFAQDLRTAQIAKQGGEIVRKGAFQGKVSIVNRQTRLPQEDCTEVAALLAGHTQCNIVADDGSGAAVRLFVVDDPGEPAMLLAPEDGWGRLNVARMVDDLPGRKAKDRFFRPRARKMVIKAMSLLMGGGSSQFPGNIMNAATIRELDMLEENIPVDMVEHYQAYLAKLGVTKMEKTTYLRACREGWAPAPTNDVQRAIWERVHAVPKNPMKIEFDPERGR